MIKRKWLQMMAAFSCLFDEQARQVVDYLREENRVLREQLHDKYGCRQVRLTDCSDAGWRPRVRPLAGGCSTT